MNLHDQIHQKLQIAFLPSTLEVIDETHLHHGHAGVDPTKSSHFRIRISANSFAGLTKIEIHRKINNLLKAELVHEIHALAIEVLKT